jgi:alpha-glucosidase
MRPLLALLTIPLFGVEIVSPDQRLRLDIRAESPGQLVYRLAMRGKPVIESSRLGIVIDGADLGRKVAKLDAKPYQVRDSYSYRGIHSQAVNNANCARISINGGAWLVDARVFNDGAAFRYSVPGTGSRTPDEATEFRLPTDSTLWFHDFYGHYEGVHKKKNIAEVTGGEWAAPPLTFKLPAGGGYAAITESAIVNYPGMGLQSTGSGKFAARLGHALPVSHPYELRYTKEDIARLATPASFEGPIETPWRVILAGPDLDALVNSDVISNLAPAPDARLFPKGGATGWIKPGRAVWKYLDGGGDNSLATAKEFSRMAAELGFEYQVVEGFWSRWPDQDLKELIDYSRERGVGIFLWRHCRNLRDPAERRQLFAKLQQLGAAGMKVDFFDHEAKETMDLYQAILRDGAEFKLMFNFHGANKPAGETRMWPNELTREGVQGLEYRSRPEHARHNTTIPFTRYLAGPGDYTPVIFGDRRKETSWTHQIATAAIFTSPLLIYGAHPKSLLENPAVDVINSIPATWDETRVLPPSEIGEVAVFARRSGRNWFLAILNGPESRSLSIPLAFLGPGKYQAIIVRDKLDDPAAVVLEKMAAAKSDSLKIEMRGGGGFIARFGAL